MQVRNSTLAWSAIGLLTVGTATGLSAHGLMQGATPTATSASGDPVQSAPSQSASPQPIPMITAPNYRAIVSCNQAAVVGITTAGPMTTAGPQEDFGGPHGRDPFSQF